MRIYEIKDKAPVFQAVTAVLAAVAVYFALFKVSLATLFISMFLLAVVLSIDLKQPYLCSHVLSPGVCEMNSAADCDAVVPAMESDPEFELYKQAFCNDLRASKSKLFYSYSTRFIDRSCSAQIAEARALVDGFNKSMCKPAEPREQSALRPEYVAAAGGVGLVVAALSNLKIYAQAK